MLKLEAKILNIVGWVDESKPHIFLIFVMLLLWISLAQTLFNTTDNSSFLKYLFSPGTLKTKNLKFPRLG